MDDQQQLIFAPKLHRAADPDTSKAAGQSQQPKVAERVNIVVEILTQRGPMIDEELSEAIADAGYKWGQGTAGKRRTDAVTLGLVRDTGKRRTTSTGATAKVWAVVAEQHRASA